MSDEALSTVVDTPNSDPQESTVVNDTPNTPAPEHKPGNIDEAIDAALKQQKVEDHPDDQPVVKEEKAEKPEPKAKDDKSADEDAESDKEGDDDSGEPEQGDEKPKAEKPNEKRTAIPAPDKFLPTAKEQWVNVPHAVRSEVQRVIQETAQEAEQHKAVVERYNQIREFDEIAHSNGVDLRESLQRVAQLEALIESNPLAGVNQILLTAGPRKADGQPISLFELAQHVVQMGPDGYQRAVTQQAQQAQPQGDPRVGQLEQEIARMKQEQVTSSIIAPFAASHPRYNEPSVQQGIAFFLNSDMIPASLPPQERLAAAYDMAVRINPSADEEPAEDETSEEATERRAGDFGGNRSIKGAPPTGSNNGVKPKRKVMSRDDAINAAMAALR